MLLQYSKRYKYHTVLYMPFGDDGKQYSRTVGWQEGRMKYEKEGETSLPGWQYARMPYARMAGWLDRNGGWIVKNADMAGKKLTGLSKWQDGQNGRVL
jgi:hypothetical protein